MNIRKPSDGCRPGAGRPKGVPNVITRPLKELAAQHGPDAIQEVRRLAFVEQFARFSDLYHDSHDVQHDEAER